MGEIGLRVFFFMIGKANAKDAELADTQKWAWYDSPQEKRVVS